MRADEGNREDEYKEGGSGVTGEYILEEFSVEEVGGVIAKLKNGKSTGGSWISAEILKGH